MKPRMILSLALAALLVASLACNTFQNVEINIPQITSVETGPLVEEEITIPAPDSSGAARLDIDFGMGELFINPGAEANLLEGVATYNVPDAEPQVVEEGGRIRLRQGDGSLNFDGIPNFDDFEIKWDLKLGSQPLDLTINTGASKSKVELGGLNLVDLSISQGASEFDLVFSEPNQGEIPSFDFSAGAANVNLSGLSYANAAEMKISGGASNMVLDFSGELQRDLKVTIDAGFGNVTIIVPEGVAATLTSESAISNVATSGSWDESGNTYTMSGSGYTITIVVSLAAGNLQLQTK